MSDDPRTVFSMVRAFVREHGGETYVQAVEVFFNHPKLDWMSFRKAQTLLAPEKFSKFVAPILALERRKKKNRNRGEQSEWTGDDAPQQGVVLVRRGKKE